jgi:cytochrome c oxidase subunit 3
MSAITHHSDHLDEDAQLVHHQFEDAEQQSDTYVIGMWTFLATEVMFFGALFLTYSLYRWTYPMDFYRSSLALNDMMGGINTVILLFSSFTMACAVHFAQLRKRTMVLGSLAVTVGCALGFLVIKFFEYKEKFEHHLYPGAGFHIDPHHFHNEPPNANHAQLYFGLYFAMTGLHAVHVIIGIITISILSLMWFRRSRLVTQDYVPTELVGMYWHFVDLVWIFLFPLMYLIPHPH